MAWARLDIRTDDPRVVRQVSPDGCGAACARMVLLDRGIDVGLAEIAAWLSEPCDAWQLVERLDDLSGGRYRWRGGALDVDPPIPRTALRWVCRGGSCIAQLRTEARGDGHWVVLDGFDGRRLRVRDPEGAAYEIPWRALRDGLCMIVLVQQTREA